MSQAIEDIMADTELEMKKADMNNQRAVGKVKGMLKRTAAKQQKREEGRKERDRRKAVARAAAPAARAAAPAATAAALMDEQNIDDLMRINEGRMGDDAVFRARVLQEENMEEKMEVAPVQRLNRRQRLMRFLRTTGRKMRNAFSRRRREAGGGRRRGTRRGVKKRGVKRRGSKRRRGTRRRAKKRRGTRCRAERRRGTRRR